MDAVNLAGALLYSAPPPQPWPPLSSRRAREGRIAEHPASAGIEKEDVRALRVAPIEWLYPGACPPAAGDLLEAKPIGW